MLKNIIECATFPTTTIINVVENTKYKIIPHLTTVWLVGHLPSPMVEMKVALKASSENLKRTQVLPTPESPMRSSLNR